MRDYGEPIPAAPFIAWLEEQVERLQRDGTAPEEDGHDESAMRILAGRLGVSERSLHRYRHGLNANSEPTVTFHRNLVEDMLDRADVRFADVYPGMDPDIELEADAFCPGCHETVTPISGQCPWCDTKVATGDAPRRKLYCAREDAMRFPAIDGNCWRCGGALRGDVPRVSCACGCGETIRRFDQYGREAKYVTGHGHPKPRYTPVDAEPFAQWLEQQLRDLDPIQALSRRTAISRDTLLAILNRRESTVDLNRVRRSLWLAAREGQGKGIPPRPGSTRLGDLYPTHVRSNVCSGCGNQKAAHAELCKQCRTDQRRGRPQPRESSISEIVIQDARRLYDSGLSLVQVAEQVQPRTRCTSVDSVRNLLREQFHARGWPVRSSSEQRALTSRRAA